VRWEGNVARVREINTALWLKNVMERGQSGNSAVDGRVILKLIVGKVPNKRAWTESVCLNIGSTGGLL
jgi:hypothetical protein